MTGEIIIAVVLGLLLGSLMSVFVERWFTRDGIVTGRSRCPHCRRSLAWYDLLPLVSWFVLRGRCRQCGHTIHWRYPLMEATMATVFGVFVWRWGIPSGWELLDPVLLFCLVALLFFDERWFLLPDQLTFAVIGIAALRLTVRMPERFGSALAAAVLLASAFFLLYIATRGAGIGLGDVKLGSAVGLLFGLPVAPIVTAIAVWAGALTGIILIAVGRATRKTPLPFGTFWCAAAVFAMLWPEPLTAVSSWLTLR